MARHDESDIVNRVQVELTLQISNIINEMLINYERKFTDSPSVPYTVVIATLAQTIGHISAMFPEDEREKVIKFAVTEILENEHRMTSIQESSLHRHWEFGHA